MMDLKPVYSLSEIEAHARKAVRGAGFSWGYAEEASKAVRLLAAYQLPGAVLLAAYLTERADEGVFSGPLVSDVWTVTGSAQALCPLLSGAVLCDHAQAVVTEGNEVSLAELSYPLLVLPYIMRLSRQWNCSLQIAWEGVEFVCHQGRLLCIAADEMSATRVKQFSCRSIAPVDTGEEAGNRGQGIQDKVWQTLNAFAQHTYVPATEASRRGAGPAD